ncbi:MAG: DNA primase [Caldilineaceae bacterium]|nr:DNA primase [Caldilineaceae bacterium]
MSVSDEIKQRIDLVEFISRYTQLKKAGSTYKGTCPFHSERTPSFVVFPHTGTWHCFGSCSMGGDLFSFLMKKENLDFREALQVLAQQAGVSLDEGPSDGAQSRRALIYDANAAAAAYYQQILRTHPGAAAARDYLVRRGIDDATVDAFQIGFSLDQWSSLRDHLLAQKFSVDLLVEAGLVKYNDARDSTYDAFRGRVMIPIRDRMARVIGFGGRVLDGSQPKYLNTAESPVFHKSHVIYGLDMAYQAIRDANKVVIVEGYMDVIAAHQHGFANVVACMGTALTPEQLQQLQRYTSNYVLALDADAAGQQATIRGLNQARQSLTRIRKPAIVGGGLRMEDRLGAALFIAAMPEGRDPDDVVRQNPEQWQQFIDQAKPLVDFYFTAVAGGMDLNSARGKGAAVAELAPLIAELDDEIEREHYIQQLSRMVQLDERTIAGRVQATARTAHAPLPERTGERTSRFGIQKRSPASKQQENARSNEPPFAADVSPVAAVPAKTTGLGTEDYLLAHMLREPDLLIWLVRAADDRDLAAVDIQDWQHVENQEIFRALNRFMSSDIQWDVEMFQDSLPGALHGRLAQLIALGTELPSSTNDELRADLLKVLVRLRLDRLRDRSMQVKFLIDEASQSGDREDTRDLYALNNQMLRDLSHLQTTYHQLSRVLASQGRAEQGVKIRQAATGG